MRWLISLVTVLMLTVQVSAQECADNCRVRAGEPFVVFTDAQPDATGYRLNVNGHDQIMVPVLVNGLVEYRFSSGLSNGRYTFVIDVVKSSNTVSTFPGELRVAGKWKGE